MNTNPWKGLGINALPLEDSAMAKLVVNDAGDSQRAKLSSLAWPGITTVAAEIVTMPGPTVEGSSWAVWGKAGVPPLMPAKCPNLTTRGKPS